MNYNDIKGRIERTLISLKGRFDERIEDHTHFDFYERDGEKRVSITFGTKDESKLINPIMIILHNLANLKDNLKKCLTDKGHDPKVVEDAINKSLHLQVLIDIVNQEKHGAPLRSNRSNLRPFIDEPSQGYFMGSVIRDDDGNITSNDGPPIMKIDAYIRDEKGKLIFRLDELVETSYSQWIELAKKYGCRN